MRRKITVLLAVAALVALAACDTQPATDITSNAATLNAKGACTQGASGTWEYQVFGLPGRGGTWARVGPQNGFSCSQNTGEVAFTPQRVDWLAPETQYAFRLVTRLSDGTVQAWDANGANGGTAYDRFTTGPAVIEEDGPVTEVDDPSAVASAAGCRTREFKNPRVGKSWPFRTHLWTLILRTKREFCPTGPYAGQVRKMYAAQTECNITSEGAAAGWRCVPYSADDPKCASTLSKKIRANSLGGNPEHVVWTCQWTLKQIVPLTGVVIANKVWCASNYASGSGAIATNGKCDLQSNPDYRFP